MVNVACLMRERLYGRVKIVKKVKVDSAIHFYFAYFPLIIAPPESKYYANIIESTMYTIIGPRAATAT